MYGWAGSVAAFLSATDAVILDSLEQHHVRLWLVPAAESQRKAWRDELAVMRSALRAVAIAEPTATTRWSVVFEYELPLEGGRPVPYPFVPPQEG